MILRVYRKVLKHHNLYVPFQHRMMGEIIIKNGFREAVNQYNSDQNESNMQQFLIHWNNYALKLIQLS